MKRSKPLARKSSLSRVGAAGRRRKARELPEGPLDPLSWREAVWWVCGGTCVATGEPFMFYERAWDAHHPIPKRLLPPEVRYDPRNGVVLARSAHAAHTSRFRVVPFEMLPDSCMQFAREIGGWAVAALLREHPSQTTVRRA